jgi:predicted ATPase/DNA-binding SARP family transcriptional activator
VEASSESGVVFRVLGPVEALRDGSALPIGGPRQRALLALLLLESGRSVTTDRLIDELWAGEPTAGADITLRTYVSRLRAALAGKVTIATTPAGYAIEVDAESVDARRFEALIREGDAALAARNARRARTLLARALALWQGGPYGELAADGLLRADAERLEELRVHALERRVEADLALGGGGELVDELESLVRDHPYRERLWRQLMLALYRADRQADALTAYQRARALLEEQLGLEPGEELERLQLQILRHEVPEVQPTEARHNLPAPLSAFIGRTAELAEVAEHLDGARLVTLVGVGGVGKTRLALEAARARVADLPDGVFFVDLAPLTDPDLVAGHVAWALHVREQAGVAGIDRLTDHLRELEALIVLDNCEHLRPTCAELATRLLSACPRLRLLATSREVLGVPGEAAYAVPPMTLPQESGQPGSSRDAEAVQLFLARAREARPGIPEDDETIETVARICADLDGLPLAIELAAARARALSPAEISVRLRDRFRFLVSWRRLTPARHRTLREAMDWSYELLEPEEQRVLRALSVFAGGFTLDAVAAVCTNGDEDQALKYLERLVDASLVGVDTAVTPTRYRLLETVRQYGADQLRAAHDEEDLRRRHADHFTEFAVAAWHPLRTAGVWVQTEWVERIRMDRENLRAALAWYRAVSNYDAMLRIAESLWWFWWIVGELNEGRSWLGTALGHAPTSDPSLRARGHLGLGGLSWAHGDYVAAEEHARAAQVLFAELGDSHMEGSALNTLGLIANGRGDLHRAKALLEAGLRKFREEGETDPRRLSRNIAVTIDNLGSVAFDLGEREAALVQYREALELNRARDDLEGVAMNELHIAIVEAEGGRIDVARPLLASALAVYRTVGFHQYAAECLEGSSIVANGSGQHGEAAFLLAAAARLREETGAPPVPFMARVRERERAAAEAALGEESFAAFTEAAGRTPNDAALQRALDYLARPIET